MRLAINYSQPACNLINAGAIDIDLFKCASDWPDTFVPAKALRPIYLHYPFCAGAYGVPQADWALIHEQMRETETRHANTHLVPRVDLIPHIPHDSPTAAHRNELFDGMLRDIVPLIEEFGPEHVLVENAPWNPEYPSHSRFFRAAIEPELIGQIVRETGCGFLLDIGHARCTAYSLGVDPLAYMAKMPVHRICEIHFSGLRKDENDLWVDHFPLNPDDWIAIEWVLGRIRSGDWSEPWVGSFEYGGVGPLYAIRNEPAILAEQVPRLFDLVHAV